jgi:CIC family chloride channel protein
VLATLLRLPAVDRRILLAAGVGAGVAATFRAPLAGALFAAEVLYCSAEFEPEVIVPAGIASSVAYCTSGVIFGWKPLFATPQLGFNDPWQLAPYLLLAVLMCLLAAIYTRTFYAAARWFKRLPLPRYVKPAIGGCLTGAIGLGLYYTLGRDGRTLSVMSFGYGVLQDSFRQQGPGAWILLAVALGKIATTSLTIGSGGSGGVFGPSMVIGGCAGGALGAAFHEIAPGLVPYPATMVILGMAAFFSAAAKTPLSTLLIVSEMTGDYRMFLPALWVCMWSFLLSDRTSLYRSQVENRMRSAAHRGTLVRDTLSGLQVRQFMDGNVKPLVLAPEDAVGTVIDRLQRSPYGVLPVVDSEGRLAGVVDLETVHMAALARHATRLLLTTDLMREVRKPLHPDDPLDKALELFVENDLVALPVVEGDGRGRLVGFVRHSDIAQAYFRQMHGEEEGSVVMGGGKT